MSDSKAHIMPDWVCKICVLILVGLEITEGELVALLR